MKKIETKNDVLGFLNAYIDTHTCSQGKGNEVFFVTENQEGYEIKKGLPTGGCGDPHYLSRYELFDLLKRIAADQITEQELQDWEFN